MKLRLEGGANGPTLLAGISRTVPQLPDLEFDAALTAFMAAIRHIESSDNYAAVNAKTGAYGAYQILPDNWKGWSNLILGTVADITVPANQDAVAGGIMTLDWSHYLVMRGDLQPTYDQVDPWTLTAAAWNGGRHYIRITPLTDWSTGVQWYAYHAIKRMVA